jgi:hypothetical protein
MHTKGQWIIIQGIEKRFKGLRDIFVEKTHIATIQAWSEEGQANARLIAAAPELLEALENIALTADQSGLDSQSTYDGVLEDIYEATQEAIRKAKGE